MCVITENDNIGKFRRQPTLPILIPSGWLPTPIRLSTTLHTDKPAGLVTLIIYLLLLLLLFFFFSYYYYYALPNIEL
jgi:hypothetical protein